MVRFNPDELRNADKYRKRGRRGGHRPRNEHFSVIKLVLSSVQSELHLFVSLVTALIDHTSERLIPFHSNYTYITRTIPDVIKAILSVASCFLFLGTMNVRETATITRERFHL